MLRDPDTLTLFPGHRSPTHASVEDCPQGTVHQDLMFIPRKGTRTRAWHYTTGLFKTFRDITAGV